MIDGKEMKPVPLTAPQRETLTLLNSGFDLAAIAARRQVQLQTVLVNVAELVGRGSHPFRSEWLPSERYEQIQQAGAKVGWDRLKPIKESLPEEFTYGEIRLVAAHRKAQSISPLSSKNIST